MTESGRFKTPVTLPKRGTMSTPVSTWSQITFKKNLMSSTCFVNLKYSYIIHPKILIALIFSHNYRCWALALFGGNGETGFEQNSTYSVFSISITLTDEGYEHFYEVNH